MLGLTPTELDAIYGACAFIVLLISPLIVGDLLGRLANRLFN